MIPRRRKAPRMGVRQGDKVRLPDHRAWVRGFVCLLYGRHECEGRIEAAHIRSGTGGGMGLKPSDEFCVPLCAKAHSEQHSIGEDAFAAKYGIDLLAHARRLWKLSPHRIKHEREQK